MQHRFSMMNHKVDNSSVYKVVNKIRLEHPDLEESICQDYSKRSGIAREYIDLVDSIRGYMSMGLISI